MPAQFKFRVSWLIVLGLATVLLILSPQTASAQTDPLPASTSAAIQQTMVINPLSPQYTNLMVINWIHTFSCFAEGSSIIGQPCIEYKPGTLQGTVSQPSKGLIGSITGLIGEMYDNPPANTRDYVADLGNNLNLTKPVYAQVTGTGSSILSPMFNLWKIFRNISYVVMIVVFLVVGMMIMFRQKLNPQTVISAQNALPSLIIGLILITFSYFLASLVVDAAFVGTYLAGNIFEHSDPAILKPGATNDMLKKNNILDIYNSFINFKNLPDVVGTTINTVDALKEGHFMGDFLSEISFIGGCVVGHQINLAGSFVQNIPVLAGTANCFSGGIVAFFLEKIPGLVGGLAGLLLYVILMLALLIALFRLLFALIQNYITIIVMTIASPIYFLSASLPGRSSIASNWFKTMLANILAFPAVFAAMIFAAYILGGTNGTIQIAGNGSASFPGGTVPLLGGLDTSFLQLVLAYGVLLMSPTIPESVKNMFGVKGGFQALTKSAFGGLGAGFGLGQNTFNALTGPIQRTRQALRDDILRNRHYGKSEEELRGLYTDQPWITLGVTHSNRPPKSQEPDRDALTNAQPVRPSNPDKEIT